ncbi:hypothetical protein GZ77_13395 [Endozoicomonas montiporae]|uniref:DUF1365 domain-containing protein n=2 Tax=Endozoicomonas montiporae TaxID=1027273 RepID=A0A081N4L7_9GAMM|nr:DUF1365 domain-containing protein [Endozoicomonas montiporae]AMO57744.1 hypothetical protein EZMO1_3795 [Endozoicomonas montiporae CL-33]KEQ13390.1 hypothetical protein GZ77_13395 [Endozoicomonas montiporae]
MKSAIYWGSLMHNRIRPKKHRFRYRMASWLIDLDDLQQLDKRLWLFSFNSFNLITFQSKDYGDGSGRCLKQQVNELLVENSIQAADRVELMCSPRMLGYVFNPLSVYFCYRNDQPLAMVYEVTNTFGERHSYVIPVEDSDQTLINQTTSKRLHVSPFFAMNCQYRFRVKIPDNSLSLGIELLDEQGKLFAAVFQGQKKALSNQQTILQLCLLPWQTLKVISAIHWEALKLWIKGIKIVRHQPAEQPFSWSLGKSLVRKGNHL